MIRSKQIRSRTALSVALALGPSPLVAAQALRAGPGGHRQARSDEQEGARRLRHARLGRRQADAARRAGRREEGRPRQPPGHGAHLRPPGRRLHHRLQGPAEGACRASSARWRSIPTSSFRRGSRPPEVNDGVRRGASAARRGRWAAATMAAPPPAKKRRGPGHGGRRRRGRRRRAEEARRASSSVDRTTSRRARPAGPHQRARLPDAGRGDHRQAGRPLRCAVAPNLPVAKVFLMYQRARQGGLHRGRDDEDPKGWLHGKIPKKAVTGKSLQFYFEGRNAEGKPVVAQRRADSPNICSSSRRRTRRRDEDRSAAAAAARTTRTRSRSRRARGRASRLGQHRQGARRARHPLRQAQVVDWHRHRQRLRLREGQRARGGERLARPEFHGLQRQLPCPAAPGRASATSRPRSATSSAQHRAVARRAVAVHPAAVEVRAASPRAARSRCSRS